MKRKILILAGFALALAACFGGWLALNRAGQEPEPDTLWQLDAAVTAVSVTDGDGAVLTLEQTGDGWILAEDSSFPLDQSYPEAMASALTAPVISRVLSEDPDLAGWGLDAPWATVTATAGGSSYTLRFGSQNPVTNQYYATVEGREGLVYMLSSDLVSPFTADLKTMAALPDPFGPLDSTSIYDIRITSAAGTVRLYSDNGWQVMCEEQALAATAADSTGPDEIVSDAGYLYYDELVSWKAESELALYGLDQPDMTVQLRGWSIDDPDIAMTCTFRLKQIPEDTDWYMWEEGGSCICTVSNYLVNRINPDPAYYLPAAQ